MYKKVEAQLATSMMLNEKNRCVHFFLIRFFEHMIHESKFEVRVENSELQITKNTGL